MAQKTTSGLPGMDFMTQIAEMQKDGIAPLQLMAPIWAQATRDYVQEVGRFMTARLEKDIEAQNAMVACSDLDDLRELHSSFLHQAIEDYREETKRLSEIVERFYKWETEDA